MSDLNGFLDHAQSLDKADPSGMLDRVAALPYQCREGWDQGRAWTIPAAYRSAKNLIVLGMGGSAIGADILTGILGDRVRIPVSVNRTYTIPDWVGRETLALACSYSGNTEETLSGAREAVRRGARIAAITSGGDLAAWARRDRFPLLQIPSGMPPRSAVGYLAFAPMGLFTRLGLADRASLPVEQACAGLEKFIASKLAPEVRSGSNTAKQLAKQLVGRLPVLYGAAGGWEGITYRWRTQLEENSKTLAFHHIFPEATHNEISAWLQPKGLMGKATAVFLRDADVHPRTLRRMEFTKKIVRAEGAAAIDVSAPGRSRMERMLNLIAIGDFTSVYLGMLYRIDPTPVVRVEALKKFMKR